jgi:hypothetical protein
MSSLHEGAPVHSYAHTRRAVESAFGLRLDQLFITFDPKPLASGSVAQVRGCDGCWVPCLMCSRDVHGTTMDTLSASCDALRSRSRELAALQTCTGPAFHPQMPPSLCSTACCLPSSQPGHASPHHLLNLLPLPLHSPTPSLQIHRAMLLQDGQLVRAAVKVRHPGVARQIGQDFRLLKPLAAWASRFRALQGLSLKESVSQFSSTMTAQTDLRVEAAHLERFGANFASVSTQVVVHSCWWWWWGGYVSCCVRCRWCWARGLLVPSSVPCWRVGVLAWLLW